LLLKVYFQSFGIDFDPCKSLVDETLFDSIIQNTQLKGKKREQREDPSPNQKYKIQSGSS
jgi:hypothetical protein